MSSRTVLLSVAALAAVVAAVLLVWPPSDDERKPASDPAPLMRANLAEMRGAIKRYREREKRFPAELQELVESGDLRGLPADPVTRSRTSWRPVRQKVVVLDEFMASSSAEQPGSGIIDVKSGAPGLDRRGIAWSDY